MEISEVLRVLRKGVWLIVALSIVGLAAGYAVTANTPKSYSSKVRLFVSVQTSGAQSAYDVGQGSTAAQSKVKSYLDLVTSSNVLVPVIEELHLRTTPRVLAQSVKATTPANSVSIEISVTNTSPRLAAETANAIGKSFSNYVVKDIETPDDGSATPVKIVPIEAAIPATTPTSPDLKIDLAFGLLAGLAVSIALVFLRATLDTRLQSTQDLASITEAPVIGGIGFDATARSAPLVVHLEPRSPRAEAFRDLRTNLQFLDVESTRRSFVVTSAMPSEGKTTTTANLAIALAEGGTRVAVVDADLRRPRLAATFGIEGAVGLTEALVGRASVSDVLQSWGPSGNLVVLPAGQIPPNPSELLGSRTMRELVEALTNDFDVVLIDAPPLLPVTDAAVVSKMCNGVVLVAAAKRSRRPLVKSAIARLEKIDSRLLGVIVTMLPTKGGNAYAYGAYGDYYGSDAASQPDPTMAGTRRAHLRRTARRARA
ncbi:Tyrosine-protein kinase YwqD [Frondihabitans sp. 762G35]|uniref:polysaccharide biosynthesis tyrosine autokinase n=1 Tax=Frondihabitans sp. 762G35 TaxID=1446794 RepID=UPI000D227349|nr:polysaccharide biosynthesis tyrosine autokinase [Frondihabitans sp. 762G35]ARC58225.1 Tyrosine-protein kinase YwqD [Frondihabitans sp. 762G35]